MKNPILFFLLLFFSLAILGDIITSHLVKTAEANPIYLLTNNIYIISFIKIIFIVILIIIYNINTYKTHYVYYNLLLILVLSTILFMFAIYGNVIGILNPILVQKSINIPNNIKIIQYTKFVGLIYLIPLFFSTLTFKFYEWSLKYITITNERK